MTPFRSPCPWPPRFLDPVPNTPGVSLAEDRVSDPTGRATLRFCRPEKLQVPGSSCRVQTTVTDRHVCRPSHWTSGHLDRMILGPELICVDQGENVGPAVPRSSGLPTPGPRWAPPRAAGGSGVAKMSSTLLGCSMT